MPHIIIDGYNFIMRTTGSDTVTNSSMETLRRTILDRVARYKRQSSSKVTVVFDAYNSLSPERHSENYRGVNVVFSRENETADEVIIGWIREGRGNMVIVSSDRAIIDEAKREGIAFITPRKLEDLIMGETLGKDEDTDEEETPWAEKRGNPRKLPKKLRKATKTLGKIR